MNDLEVLAVGRQFVELTCQREVLLQEKRTLLARLEELEKVAPNPEPPGG
jgi:hypothetical protein